MKMIVSGGGTGGHIYPALAIVDAVKKKVPDAEFLYVGKKGGLEEELAAKAGLPFRAIRVKGLPRKKINKDSFLSMIELLRGLKDAGEILKDFRPDVVVGTGGYVCAPILLKAQNQGIPTAIQEQNAYPGKTNRLLGKRVQLVAYSFSEAEKYFPEETPKLFTGNPIRDTFEKMDEATAKKTLDWQTEKDAILSFGGSGGQESTNEAVLEIMEKHRELPFYWVHITGKDHYEDFLKRMPEVDAASYKILDYSHEIPEYLALAKGVVASSSAMTLAEISAMHLPSVLIPKAYTAGNHQFHNAVSYRDKGAAFVIEESELNGDVLLNKVLDLLEDKETARAMGDAANALSNPGATAEIADAILEIANHG
ncbi:UDP-N-acetylglucosamine--N-acetylmuramyl-(pentapeptide) pyrophosphoryl-undecaprenol N-acetylglucosamine transferase [Peptoniphilus ivorii]|uniref:undecaprenyldiphospho-muramoylpentapeptide beta-N-acetylglucosaminyltransferase n=1 Tax=Aedoeadaptatus ivorii TaxID=54006 RepID=UPI00277D71B3|nr:undecaprenyldiphospho-muramoylpentapeptide beta-N-acetylglucosaminyltransferase [Peptoniphilus ivorii]MDQ0508937.1 UDP-N-acetylglucosamine--N-acetylmuramyl-(pentapeptide) pyrophosphoryl-undecaprenol N-acetylglucosamine transferase [Peptoniphilus ivorii]